MAPLSPISTSVWNTGMQYNMPAIDSMTGCIPLSSQPPIFGSEAWNDMVKFDKSSDSASTSMLDIYEANQAKALEQLNVSVLFPDLGLTKAHDAAVKKLLEQYIAETGDVQVLPELMSIGGAAMNLMWLPMIKGGVRMFGFDKMYHRVADPIANKWHQSSMYGKYNSFKTSSTGLKIRNTIDYGQIKMGKSALNATGSISKTVANGCFKATKSVCKYGGWTAAAAVVIEDKDKISTAFKHDSKTGWKQTGQTAAKATGAGVGAWAGAKAGAGIGATIGSCLGPVGTAVGGFLGGLVGAIGGAIGGKWLAKKAVGPDAVDKIAQEKLEESKTVEKAQANATTNNETINRLLAWIQTKLDKNGNPPAGFDPVAIEALSIISSGQPAQATAQ